MCVKNFVGSSQFFLGREPPEVGLDTGPPFSWEYGPPVGCVCLCVLLCFIKPILGNRYVRSLGFIGHGSLLLQFRILFVGVCALPPHS